MTSNNNKSYRQRLNTDLQIAIKIGDKDMQLMVEEKLQQLKDYHKEYKRNARKASRERPDT